MMYDLIIVGGGPAGLTAGLYAARRNLSVLLFEKGMAGGQMLLTPEIENYPGFDKISGGELAVLMKEQAEKSGVQIKTEDITSFELSGDIKKAMSGETSYSARALILANGGEYRKLGAKNEEKYTGRGVSYCATCDAPFFRGRVVAVVGGGNKAVSDALYLSEIAEKVYLIHRRDTLRAEEANQKKLLEKGVEFVLNSEVEEFRGEVLLDTLVLRGMKTDGSKTLEVNGAFICIGTVPKSKVALAAGINADPNGFIVVDNEQKTNIPGVYAAGDVTGGVMQISTAIGEGCKAALSAYGYVKSPYWSEK